MLYLCIFKCWALSGCYQKTSRRCQDRKTNTGLGFLSCLNPAAGSRDWCFTALWSPLSAGMCSLKGKHPLVLVPARFRGTLIHTPVWLKHLFLADGHGDQGPKSKHPTRREVQNGDKIRAVSQPSRAPGKTDVTASGSSVNPGRRDGSQKAHCLWQGKARGAVGVGVSLGRFRQVLWSLSYICSYPTHGGCRDALLLSCQLTACILNVLKLWTLSSACHLKAARPVTTTCYQKQYVVPCNNSLLYQNKGNKPSLTIKQIAAPPACCSSRKTG